jgi:hypothetical protein
MLDRLDALGTIRKMAESTMGLGQNALGGKMRKISQSHCDCIQIDSAL